jgi:hypothetical protein
MKKKFPKAVYVYEISEHIDAGTRVGVYELKGTGTITQPSPTLVLDVGPTAGSKK